MGKNLLNLSFNLFFFFGCLYVEPILYVSQLYASSHSCLFPSRASLSYAMLKIHQNLLAYKVLFFSIYASFAHNPVSFPEDWCTLVSVCERDASVIRQRCRANMESRSHQVR